MKKITNNPKRRKMQAIVDDLRREESLIALTESDVERNVRQKNFNALVLEAVINLSNGTSQILQRVEACEDVDLYSTHTPIG